MIYSLHPQYKIIFQASSLLLHASSSSVAPRTIVTPRWDKLPEHNSRLVSLVSSIFPLPLLFLALWLRLPLHMAAHHQETFLLLRPVGI